MGAFPGLDDVHNSRLRSSIFCGGAALLAAENALEPMFLESMQPHKVPVARAKRKRTVSPV